MNPFGVPDVMAPDWMDVQLFADTVGSLGGPVDENAPPWAEGRTRGSIDGEWAGRWRGGSAEGGWAVSTATITTVDERVYILFRQGVYGYLIDTRKVGENQLVGKYLNLQEHRDTYPWVGLIVNAERID